MRNESDSVLGFVPIEPANRVHVYPLFGKPHTLFGFGCCWCEPQIDDENPNVIVHKPDH